MAASAFSGGFGKDPRMLRDKQWQNVAVDATIQFLHNQGFERDLSVKMLTAPTAKEFMYIFKFLYEKLDPSFPWQNKKFEEEVLMLLRALKYPFVD